ncbi:protein-ER retention protein [Lobulomyces angularis]|nr:protein-ER retention protein [Lobulomyces angularis]
MANNDNFTESFFDPAADPALDPSFDPNIVYPDNSVLPITYHVQLTLSLISLFSCSLVILSYFLARIYCRDLTQRVTYLLTVFTAIVEAGFALVQIASFFAYPSNQLRCTSYMFFYVFFSLMTAFIPLCIAINLQTVFIYNRFQDHLLWKYLTVSGTLALFFAVFPVFFGNTSGYYFDEVSQFCWFSEANKLPSISAGVSYYGPITLSIVFSIIITGRVSAKLVQTRRQISSNNASFASQNLSFALSQKKTQKILAKLISRLIFYPIVPLLGFLFNLLSDAFFVLGDGQIPLWINMASYFGTASEGLLTAILFFSLDPVWTRLFQRLKREKNNNKNNSNLSLNSVSDNIKIEEMASFDVNILIVLGIWAWSINVHILNYFQIDLINIPEKIIQHFGGTQINTLQKKSCIYLNLYSLSLIYSLFVLIGFKFFEDKVKQGGLGLNELDWEKVSEIQRHPFETIPLALFFFLIFFTCLPFDIFFFKVRRDFVRCLGRIAFGGFNSPVTFSDVILADILTSYSRVVGDLQLVMIDFVYEPAEKPASGRIKTENKLSISEFMVPILIWLIEAVHIYHGKFLEKVDKYDMVMRSSLVEEARFKFHSCILFWVIFSFINSMFSIYWDIVNDWSLFYKTPSTGIKNNSTHKFLRPILIYKPIFYYLAIIFDIFCRLTWLIKLTIFFNLVDLTLKQKTEEEIFFNFFGKKFTDNNLSFILLFLDFGLKFLEIFRRFIWVFFRVEREYVVKKLNLNGKICVPLKPGLTNSSSSDSIKSLHEKD